MHDVRVKMRDGRIFVGPLWTFRAREGYFSIVDEEAPPQIRFTDVESAVNEDVRFNIRGEVRQVDLIDRAKKEGWDGT
jgi:hypothetical protein